MFSVAEMTSVMLMNDWMRRAMDAEYELRLKNKIIQDLEAKVAHLESLTICGAD